MSNWLHRLLNPHCEFCKLDKECINCDMLRQLLSDERENVKRLLSAILQDNKSIAVDNDEEIKPVQIGNKTIPWRIRREMLEAEDRAKAKLEREGEFTSSKIASIEELEKELGITDATKIRETEKIYASDGSGEKAYEGNRSIS